MGYSTAAERSSRSMFSTVVAGITKDAYHFLQGCKGNAVFKSARCVMPRAVRVHRFRCKNIDRSCHTNGRSRAGDEARSRAVGQIGLGAGRCGRWRPAHGSSCRAEAEHRWQRPMEGWRPGHAARRAGCWSAAPCAQTGRAAGVAVTQHRACRRFVSYRNRAPSHGTSRGHKYSPRTCRSPTL